MSILVFILLVLQKIIGTLSFILALYALLSWFPGAYNSAIGRIIIAIAEPILRPFRRFNLQFGGLDWTVFIVIVGLNFLSRWLVNWFVLLG